MRKPRLLDLFCCQGGASHGYVAAGFDVVGVDIEPQPRYPFPFHEGDALEVLSQLILAEPLGEKVEIAGGQYSLGDFAAIHASPPCQAYSTITPDKSKHPELIIPVRGLLREAGLPYVIENVDGAKRELVDPVMLCGSSFGLRVRRHRWFESDTVILGMLCRHAEQGEPVGVYGDHPDSREFFRPDGSRRGAKATSVDDARDAMGMPWADWSGVAEAIPPAYTEYIGRQLMTHVREEVAA